MQRLGGLVLVALLASAVAHGDARAAAQEPLPDAARERLTAITRGWIEAQQGGDGDAVVARQRELWRAAQEIDAAAGGDLLARLDDWSRILGAARNHPELVAERGRVVRHYDAGWNFDYALSAPLDYTPSKGPWPLLVLVVAEGEPDAAIARLPAATRARACIVCPDLRDVARSMVLETGRVRLLRSLGAAFASFRVDRDRVGLLAGPGAGLRAGRIAALVPHFFHGVALVYDEPLQEPEFELLDRTTGALSPAVIEVDDADLPRMVTQGGFRYDYSTDRALAWLASFAPRNPYPLEFSAEFSHPSAGRIYWVQATRFDPAPLGAEPAILNVSVDRGSNTITLDATRVYQVQLFLNDRIVDLDRPITIVRNGHEYDFQAARSLRSLLENYAANSDDRAVFPALVRAIDLPPKTP